MPIIGIIIGYLGTNLIGETNLIQRLGIFSDGPESAAPLFAGLVLFPLLALGAGFSIWKVLKKKNLG
jgi:hypothetical protein